MATAAGTGALFLAASAGAEQAVFKVSRGANSDRIVQIAACRYYKGLGGVHRDLVLEFGWTLTPGPFVLLSFRPCLIRHPTSPQASSLKAPFIEQFISPVSDSRWTVSRATKQTPVGDEIFSYVGVWSVEEPDVFPGIQGDTGLVLSESNLSFLFNMRVDVYIQSQRQHTTRSRRSSPNRSTRRISRSWCNTRSSSRRDSIAAGRTSSSCLSPRTLSRVSVLAKITPIRWVPKRCRSS